jgi:two-component system KDP operon response regulator KdpE
MIPRILIIDDEEAIRFFAADSLTTAGWEVYEADSGEAALELLSRVSCDIIFLDLRMEGMGGLETLRRIKAGWPETDTVIMTAFPTLDSAIEAVRQEVSDYLRKPCSSQDMLDSVQRILKRRTTQSSERFQAAVRSKGISSLVQTGELVIDRDARRALLANQTLSLTPTEYEILAVLGKTLGQPVSLEQLVVEGLNYAPNDAQARETLRVHVSRLRQKVGAEYILTVRGGGYALAYFPPNTPPGS